ncbi:hypothetical protein Poli38472_014638 [Pythium oligandrum]|uniref:Uncharacterized protein n=1 Tax=Pythium oligandrum TaxID=41045 RepID=A0A8K1CJ88_PYTOL|nr:hypothetical protein Poli38472_014638 [Pythium oligandrum]|eukprot:TMW63933.1 hypothetical protein Poli38472_014638 [Pythium oligandrum]
MQVLRLVLASAVVLYVASALDNSTTTPIAPRTLGLLRPVAFLAELIVGVTTTLFNAALTRWVGTSEEEEEERLKQEEEALHRAIEEAGGRHKLSKLLEEKAERDESQRQQIEAARRCAAGEFDCEDVSSGPE